MFLQMECNTEREADVTDEFIMKKNKFVWTEISILFVQRHKTFNHLYILFGTQHLMWLDPLVKLFLCQISKLDGGGF